MSVQNANTRGPTSGLDWNDYRCDFVRSGGLTDEDHRCKSLAGYRIHVNGNPSYDFKCCGIHLRKTHKKLLNMDYSVTAIAIPDSIIKLKRS